MPPAMRGTIAPPTRIRGRARLTLGSFAIPFLVARTFPDSLLNPHVMHTTAPPWRGAPQAGQGVTADITGAASLSTGNAPPSTAVAGAMATGSAGSDRAAAFFLIVS